uniref:Uncharacterized protein n=1 Tax=Choristoneura fumiferana nuclear polyhedrosis virus TaxID=208973 RepID=Q6LCC5_NPVCF|nr:unknown [Choristoneura fumiferana multiple nucleopolyhedrovirus]
MGSVTCGMYGSSAVMSLESRTNVHSLTILLFIITPSLTATDSPAGTVPSELYRNTGIAFFKFVRATIILGTGMV